jgi:hypothetical protein
MIKKLKRMTKERSFIIRCHSIVAEKLREGIPKTITRLRLKYFIGLTVQADDSIPADQLKFISKKTAKEFTLEAS